MFNPKKTAFPQGFALVLALSLMSFIVLLLLGITTLAQVELQFSNTSLQNLEARMNARLGAMVALGDLQRYTGPDQRVTARSDILVPADSNPLPGQGRWTGVWSSKSVSNSEDDLDELNRHRPRWLVSGENPDAETALSPAQVVRLATVGSSILDKSNAGIDDSVHVPVESITDRNGSTKGKFAYWVSDEGIKARVDLSDPYLGESSPKRPIIDESCRK